jgi:hypothetical protein
MQEVRLHLEVNTTSEKLRRFVSGVVLEAHHLPVKWRRRRSTLTSASIEDVSRRRLIFAFERRSGLRLDLALAAGVYWWARKRKNGLYVVSARPVHRLHRVIMNARRLLFAGESARSLQSQYESQLLRLRRPRHHRSLSFDHLLFKKSSTTIATLITALNLLVNRPLRLHHLLRQVRLVKTTWKLRSTVPAHAMASTLTKISSSSKTDMSDHVAPGLPSVNDLEASQHAASVRLQPAHLLDVVTTTM